MNRQSMFLRNVGLYQRAYMTSQPWTTSSFSSPWESKAPHRLLVTTAWSVEPDSAPGYLYVAQSWISSQYKQQQLKHSHSEVQNHSTLPSTYCSLTSVCCYSMHVPQSDNFKICHSIGQRFPNCGALLVLWVRRSFYEGHLFWMKYGRKIKYIFCYAVFFV
jgi:hypothetical protein